MEYTILLLPRNDQLYWEQAQALATAELQVLNQRIMMGNWRKFGRESGGHALHQLSGPGARPGRAKAAGGPLFLLWSLCPSGELLLPLNLPRPDYFPEDILSHNYSSRANGAYIAMLYNVTLWSGAFAPSSHPACGSWLPSAAGAPCCAMAYTGVMMWTA